MNQVISLFVFIHLLLPQIQIFAIQNMKLLILLKQRTFSQVNEQPNFGRSTR